jgi:CBS domain-containing protein
VAAEEATMTSGSSRQPSDRPSDPVAFPDGDSARTASSVRDIMQTKIVTVSVTERLSTVEDIMTLGRVRHMPVVHGGKLVGVLSHRDLLRASLSELGSFGTETRRAFLHVIEIDQVMARPPITIGPRAAIQLAARLMADHRIGCLPVVDGDELVGLITETDILHWVAGVAPDRAPE